RRIDKAFRYGGEEFVVILPETPKDHGVLIAERIRKEFENQTFLGSSPNRVGKINSF
ncbi:MAG: diguanylate cyclase, partial [Candidatus Atribacteria bacterium]|nr:diguanylate cyclase [Candidatus Atribacteria bacterium]